MRQQTGSPWGVVALAWGRGGLFVFLCLATAVLDVGDTGVSRDLDRPLLAPVAWLGGGLGGGGFYLVALTLPLLFPDGRLLSARWRPVAWLGLVSIGCTLVGAVLGAGPVEVAAEKDIPNPFAVTGAAQTVVSVVEVTGYVLFMAATTLSIAALVVRLHRSRGRRRQQVKWFAYVTSLALCALLLAQIEALGDGHGWTQEVGAIGFASGLALVSVGIPAAVGIAILRHHLYDIDLVIRSTLVYALLTVALGAAYWGLVVGLPRLVNLVATDNDLMIAASTLAVAALFRPVRGRIQTVVDRRFYRRKYDAARTVEAFAGRLRHEVDLASVTADLEVVVRDTMQPTHVSLWLRGAP